MYSKKPTRQESGKTNVTGVKGRAGIYFIVEETINENGRKTSEEIVYVGMSSYDLYKTITRHFQTWNDRDQVNRISYKSRIVRKTHNYHIAAIVTSPTTAKLVEKELILMYAPRDNKQKLAFYEQASDITVITGFLRELAFMYQKQRNRVLDMLSNPKKYGRKATNDKRKNLNAQVKDLAAKIKATGFNTAGL